MSGFSSLQEEEIRKCAASFEYFCEKYVQIIHPVRGLVPFNLYKYQNRVVSDFDKFQFNIVKKFRQAGLTTVAVIWALWRCMFKFDQRIMVLSKTDREAIGVGKIVENVKEYLPDWLRPTMKTDNDHEKEFSETGSVLWFYTPSAARSKALTYLIVDEAAFIQGMDDHWKAMYPTLAAGGNCIVISTVNGIGNWYEETYTKAQDKKNQFHIIDLDYREHPDYASDEWATKMRANLGERGWLQEILGSFLGSKPSFIDANIIAEYEKMCIDPVDKLFPEWDSTKFEDMDESELKNEANYKRGALWIWKEPIATHEYVLMADASDGVGEDNSAIIILDLSNYDQVSEFYSNTIPLHKFSQICAQIANYYNEGLIVIESLGQGATVLNRLEHTLKYGSLHYEHKSGGSKAGVTINKNTRAAMMDALQTCFMNKLIRIRSRRLIRELRTFMYNSSRGRAEALKNHHDDLVLCLGLGLYAIEASSKDLPVGVETMNNRIAASLTGKSLTDVRNEIFSGIDNDFVFEENKMQLEDFLPNIMFGDFEKKRINRDFLKELDF